MATGQTLSDQKFGVGLPFCRLAVKALVLLRNRKKRILTGVRIMMLPRVPTYEAPCPAHSRKPGVALVSHVMKRVVCQEDLITEKSSNRDIIRRSDGPLKLGGSLSIT